jgi:hypothetical protein
MSVLADKGSYQEKMSLKATDGDYAVFHERIGKFKVSTLRILNSKFGSDTTFVVHGTFKKLHVDVKHNWVIMIGDLKNEENADQFVVYNLKGEILFSGGIECERFPPRFGCTESISRKNWYDPDSKIEVTDKGFTIRAPDKINNAFINLKD